MRQNRNRSTPMKLVLLGAVLWLFSGTPAVADTGQSFYFYPGQPVLIEQDHAGDILVVGTDVRVDATVDGNVSVLGGDVMVGTGTVTGDAVVIAGDLAVNEGGKVQGSQVVLAGGLKKNRAAVLTLSVLFWLLTIGFGYFFFPGRIRENAFEMADDFLRAFLLGVYATFIVVALALLSFILVQVVVGIFLSVVVLMFALTLYLFSVLTLFYFLGELIWKRIFRVRLPGLAYLCTGLVFYELLAWLGLIGFLGTTVLMLGAVGATLLSRFGSFKPWFGVPRYWGHS